MMQRILIGDEHRLHNNMKNDILDSDKDIVAWTLCWQWYGGCQILLI